MTIVWHRENPHIILLFEGNAMIFKSLSDFTRTEASYRVLQKTPSMWVFCLKILFFVVSCSYIAPSSSTNDNLCTQKRIFIKQQNLISIPWLQKCRCTDHSSGSSSYNCYWHTCVCYIFFVQRNKSFTSRLHHVFLFDFSPWNKIFLPYNSIRIYFIFILFFSWKKLPLLWY